MSKEDFLPWDFFVAHFNAARMNVYLVSAKADTTQAKAVYVWHATIAAAFWELIGHLEVALRNLISRKLGERQNRMAGTNEWVFDLKGDIFIRNPNMAKEVERVLSRLSQKNKQQTQDRVISDLPFGFWHQLLSKNNTAIWSDIASGFKGLDSRKQEDVSLIVSEIRTMRNRIGHHHRIYHLDLKQKHENLMLLAHYIDPEFGMWLRSKSRVDELLLLRPQASPALQTLQPTPPKPQSHPQTIESNHDQSN